MRKQLIQGQPGPRGSLILHFVLQNPKYKGGLFLLDLEQFYFDLPTEILP